MFPPRLEELPQFPIRSPLEYWVEFCTLFSGRPTKSLKLICPFQEKERAAHLLPLAPGRAVEGFEKDSKIKFEHRLFKRVNPVNRERFLRNPIRIEGQSSLAFLFNDHTPRFDDSD